MLAGPAQAETKVLGSRFLAYGRSIQHPELFREWLESMRREHHRATHHCYAYRIGFPRMEIRTQDDGEPSGTAGVRILQTIEKRNLFNVAIIVVRYFGGTKLGLGGLGRAYEDACEAMFRHARVIAVHPMTLFIITFPHEITSQVHYAIDQTGAEVIERRYEQEVHYRLRIRRSRARQFTVLLHELTAGSVSPVVEQDSLRFDDESFE